MVYWITYLRTLCYNLLSSGHFLFASILLFWYLYTSKRALFKDIEPLHWCAGGQRALSAFPKVINKPGGSKNPPTKLFTIYSFYTAAQLYYSAAQTTVLKGETWPFMFGFGIWNMIIASQTSSYGFHQQKQKNEKEKDVSGYLIFPNPLSTLFSTAPSQVLYPTS